MTDVCRFDVKQIQFASFTTTTSAPLMREGSTLRVASQADRSLSHDSESYFLILETVRARFPAAIRPRVLRFQKKLFARFTLRPCRQHDARACEKALTLKSFRAYLSLNPNNRPIPSVEEV